MKSSERHASLPVMSPWVIIVALSCLLGLQPLATDLYLPALPQMRQALGVTQADAQWTLSALILAFGCAQLVWGPVSDRVGRKPVLLIGLALFVLASILTVLASSLTAMIAGRIGQGLGLGATVVCARAMIRDLYTPQEGARVLSKGLTGLSVVALVGPILGGLAAQTLGWRATLGLVGLFALLTLLWLSTQLHETLPLERRDQSVHWRERLAQWRHITRQPMFRAYTALTSSTYAGLYVYLAASSYVFIDLLHVSQWHFGIVMASMSMSYLLGTVLCRYRLRRHDLPSTTRLGAWLSASAGVCCLGLSALSLLPGWQMQAWMLWPGMWLYGLAHGIHQPCSQVGVVAAFPAQAGAASALSGFIMSALAFGVAALLSAWMQHPLWAGTIHPLTLGQGIGALLTAAVGLGPVQKYGHA